MKHIINTITIIILSVISLTMNSCSRTAEQNREHETIYNDNQLPADYTGPYDFVLGKTTIKEFRNIAKSMGMYEARYDANGHFIYDEYDPHHDSYKVKIEDISCLDYRTGLDDRSTQIIGVFYKGILCQVHLTSSSEMVWNIKEKYGDGIGKFIPTSFGTGKYKPEEFSDFMDYDKCISELDYRYWKNDNLYISYASNSESEYKMRDDLDFFGHIRFSYTGFTPLKFYITFTSTEIFPQLVDVWMKEYNSIKDTEKSKKDKFNNIF